VVIDDAYMAQAILLAGRGRGRTTPNPKVGALVVSPDGVVVGRGYHEAAGRPHAEVGALEEAGARARGATLYCTLEPCCHWGRTGPCTERILAAGIARVVAAMEDPDPRVRGRGFEALRAGGIRVDVGPGHDPAARLNAPFVTAVTRARPFVTIKVALSLDGRVAPGPGRTAHLTGPAADRLTHLDRAETDALGVGSGTVLADDPSLTARGAFRHRPLVRVVFDRRLRTPARARVLSTLEAGAVIIVTTVAGVDAQPAAARVLLQAGAELLVTERDDLVQALSALLDRGVQSLVVEGGPVLHEAFWRAGLVDRVRLWIAPCRLGENGVPWLSTRLLPVTGLAHCTVECHGSDVLIEGDVYRTH
jgi:diaminohydroxyphosphoribosylaminopyrimidine deaminase/5-amino-6-(5-phosphoribosylamino)uracil reductase